MSQNRELVPVSVYLPAAAKDEAGRRAAAKSVATATLLRQILLGQEPPLPPP